ncbi:MAG: hypothetical protein ACTJG1_00335 [Enterococcus gilvus]
MIAKYELPADEERLAKAFEELGRNFFDKVDARNFTHAYKILYQLTAPRQTLQETMYTVKPKKILRS